MPQLVAAAIGTYTLTHYCVYVKYVQTILHTMYGMFTMIQYVQSVRRQLCVVLGDLYLPPYICIPNI